MKRSARPSAGSLRRALARARSGGAAPPSPAVAPAGLLAGTGNRFVVDGIERRAFFVCGHPKSGTNWVGALLYLHPDINCRGEFRFEALRHGFDTLTRHPWHVAHEDRVRAVAERCFEDTVRAVMGAVVHHKPAATWIGDRTPRELRPFLPGAPHILVIRDGRDVVVSWAHQQVREAGVSYSLPAFKSALAPDREAFLADPEFFRKNPHRLLAHEPWVRFLAGRWARHVGRDLDTLDRVRRAELALAVHVVRYEKLHEDVERERAAMYRFLGLDPALGAPLSDENRTRRGFGREDPHDFYRHGAVGDWRTYFTPEARGWFKEEAGTVLNRLEYERSTDW